MIVGDGKVVAVQGNKTSFIMYLLKFKYELKFSIEVNLSKLIEFLTILCKIIVIFILLDKASKHIQL